MQLLIFTLIAFCCASRIRPRRTSGLTRDFTRTFNKFFDTDFNIFSSLSYPGDRNKVKIVYKTVEEPFLIERTVPVPIVKHVPEPVPVYVPQPYPIEKKVFVPYKIYEKQHVPVIHRYPIEKSVRVPVHMPVEQPIEIIVPEPLHILMIPPSEIQHDMSYTYPVPIDKRGAINNVNIPAISKSKSNPVYISFLANESISMPKGNPGVKVLFPDTEGKNHTSHIDTLLKEERLEDENINYYSRYRETSVPSSTTTIPPSTTEEVIPFGTRIHFNTESRKKQHSYEGKQNVKPVSEVTGDVDSHEITTPSIERSLGDTKTFQNTVDAKIKEEFDPDPGEENNTSAPIVFPTERSDKN